MTPTATETAAPPERPEQAPERAAPETLAVLGLPAGPGPDWPDALSRSLTLALRRDRAFLLALDNCNGCGACVAVCPAYQASRDPYDQPAGRIKLARRMRRRLTSPLGRAIFNKAARQRNLGEWFHYFNRCRFCRACASVCPLGLDPSVVAQNGLELLGGIGLARADIADRGAACLETGNRFGEGAREWKERCLALERELFDETGLAILAPVDEEGAEVMYVPGAAGNDAFLTAELRAAAIAFHSAGLSWTIASGAADAANPGWFLGYKTMKAINRRLLDEARRLKPRTLVFGQSGAGWRIARNYMDTMNGPLSASTDLRTKHPVHVFELLAGLLARGAFRGRLSPEANEGLRVTLHDSCQAARSTGLLKAPRALLAASVPDYVEMPRSVSGINTVCCGAGCRPLPDSGPPPEGARRARVVRAVKADTVAAGCAECLLALEAHGRADPDRPFSAAGVLDLFARALAPFLRSVTEPEPDAEEEAS